jgi:hypothetical protein
MPLHAVERDISGDRLGSTTRSSLYWTLYLFRPTNRRCKNVAARINNIASGETPISLTTVAGQSSMDLMAEGFKT